MIETGWRNIIIIIKAVFLTDKDSVLKNEITWQEYHELCVCVCGETSGFYYQESGTAIYFFIITLTSF